MLTVQKTSTILVILAIATIPRVTSNSSPSYAWQAHKVIPDVIDSPPPETLKVHYKEFDETVDLGNELTPTQVRQEPDVSWNAVDGQLYTLMMVDPDAPSRENPIMGQWRHWLVGNIPGKDVSRGTELTAYVGSGPPPKTGLHRYIFLLYKQSKRIDFDEPRVPNTSAKNRPKFCAKKFAQKYGLGEAIAGNFYLAEYDEYVDRLYEQLKE